MWPQSEIESYRTTLKSFLDKSDWILYYLVIGLYSDFNLCTSKLLDFLIKDYLVLANEAKRLAFGAFLRRQVIHHNSR